MLFLFEKENSACQGFEYEERLGFTCFLLTSLDKLEHEPTKPKRVTGLKTCNQPLWHEKKYRHSKAWLAKFEPGKMLQRSFCDHFHEDHLTLRQKILYQ